MDLFGRTQPPGGRENRWWKKIISKGDGEINPVDLISEDEDNALMLGRDVKLFAPKNSSGNTPKKYLHNIVIKYGSNPVTYIYTTIATTRGTRYTSIEDFANDAMAAGFMSTYSADKQIWLPCYSSAGDTALIYRYGSMFSTTRAVTTATLMNLESVPYYPQEI
jgi:hypothetical protein